ncbi:Ribosomal L1 domain-containing protein 1 [Cyanidiococcus yangmingshanensis]|uniref:Ribosomal L1 domain-containing protein 1 n=1 Tax=Cyanidiococcus yangmingshanensis TaxID=2690220 RepID=A0A7J7IFZ2_9RHOD|nr:Ribosomal L1 domain-containing protein 1 [Cyanidiococcus yangmingshanensis]
MEQTDSLPERRASVSTSVEVEKSSIIEHAIAALLERSRSARRRLGEQNPLIASFESDVAAADATEWVFLIITLQSMPNKLPRRPRLIPLPHSLYRPGTTDEAGQRDDARCEYHMPRSPPPAEWRERIKRLSITQVLSVRQLRRDYGRFEQRRELVASHSLFLADTRVWPMLPDLLGKEFFRRKKYPLPVNLTGLENAVPVVGERVVRACERILDSTVWHGGLSGTCCALRVGHLAMDPAALKANVLQVLHALPSLVPGGVRHGILSIYIKTQELVPIPVYVAERVSRAMSSSVPIGSKFGMWSPERRRRKGKLVSVPDGHATPLERKRRRRQGKRGKTNTGHRNETRVIPL